MAETDEKKPAGTPLQKAMSAKIGKVPIVLVGIPIVILFAVGARFFGNRNAVAETPADDTGGDPSDDSQPLFLAKAPPSNWLALDQQSGMAYSADGSQIYVPVDNAPPSTPTVTLTPPASSTPAVAAPPAKPAPPKPTAPKPAPKPTTYKIKKGDTLTAIARAHNTTVSNLVKLNGIKNPNLIYAGSTIRIR